MFISISTPLSRSCSAPSRERFAVPIPGNHGRPSYHPMLAYCAEAGACIGALLRPGNTSIGDDDAPMMKSWVRRLRARLGEHVMVTVRIDAGGDCAPILAGFHESGARFIAKANGAS